METAIGMCAGDVQKFFESESPINFKCGCVPAWDNSKHHRQVEDNERVSEGSRE